MVLTGLFALTREEQRKLLDSKKMRSDDVVKDRKVKDAKKGTKGKGKGK